MITLRDLKEKSWELADLFDDKGIENLRDCYTCIAQVIEELLGEREWGLLDLLVTEVVRDKVLKNSLR